MLRNPMLAAIAAAGSSLSSAIAAEDEHARSGCTHSFANFDVTLTLDAELGLFLVQNARNGAGSQSPSGRNRGSRDWIEGFLAPGLGFDRHAGESTVSGGFKLVGRLTRGDGDAQRTSSTSYRPEAPGIEEAFIGWKSGSLSPASATAS